MHDREVLAPARRGSVEDEFALDDRYAIAPSPCTSLLKSFSWCDGKSEVQFQRCMNVFGEVVADLI